MYSNKRCLLYTNLYVKINPFSAPLSNITAVSCSEVCAIMAFNHRVNSFLAYSLNCEINARKFDITILSYKFPVSSMVIGGGDCVGIATERERISFGVILLSSLVSFANYCPFTPDFRNWFSVGIYITYCNPFFFSFLAYDSILFRFFSYCVNLRFRFLAIFVYPLLH